MHQIRIGTAGWALPRLSRDKFPAEGANLRRYAARLNGAEINSSFYRSHRPATWTRWAESTPDDFCFAVKAPRELTHIRKLADPAGPLSTFLEEVSLLGAKLGPILVQLPPSLRFDEAAARLFFEHWRSVHSGPVACEPRHATWFESDADALLNTLQVARVAADPAVVPTAAHPGGWPGLRYWRLHGSPRMYSSSYEPDFLAALAAEMNAADTEAWCMFDNTMHGAAIENALSLSGALSIRS
jgi:uncharacterized protein YecE (DUF72 family)